MAEFTATELYELTEKPRRSDISLLSLLEFYEIYLRPFRYEITTEEVEIDLRFDEEQFCHLLGIETIAKATREGRRGNVRFLSRYRSLGGYKRIKEGKLTRQDLVDLNNTTLKSVQNKMIYFYCLPHLLDSPDSIFAFNKVNNIECEILIYNERHNKSIHLGIEKCDKGYYIPRTFLVTGKGNGKFIDGQTAYTFKGATKHLLARESETEDK